MPTELDTNSVHGTALQAQYAARIVPRIARSVAYWLVILDVRRPRSTANETPVETKRRTQVRRNARHVRLFEVPLEREREYKEWSRRNYKPARNSAEEAQVRAWLLHLVKLKGDECAAYLRSLELTALVRRGIVSELIPPAKCLVDYVSPDDAAR